MLNLCLSYLITTVPFILQKLQTQSPLFMIILINCSPNGFTNCQSRIVENWEFENLKFVKSCGVKLKKNRLYTRILFVDILSECQHSAMSWKMLNSNKSNKWLNFNFGMESFLLNSNKSNKWLLFMLDPLDDSFFLLFETRFYLSVVQARILDPGSRIFPRTWVGKKIRDFSHWRTFFISCT